MEVVSCREIALLAVLWDGLGTVSFDAETVSVEWILVLVVVVVVVVVVPFFACQMFEEWPIVK